jgi:hypothetical protein
MKAIIFAAVILLLVSGMAYAQRDPNDTGNQDSITVDPVWADSGTTSVWVPMYILADERVGFFNFPMAYHTVGGITPDSVVFFDDEGCMTSSFYTIFPNYIRIIGWFESGVDTIRCPNPFPSPNRIHFVSVRFAITPNAPPQVVTLDSTWDYVNGSLLLALADGITEFTPGFGVSQILYGHPQGIDNPNDQIPGRFALAQNYPNPFNAQTLIQYNLPVESDVNLTVFDILGRQVETLIDGYQNAGSHQVIWDADNSPSGIYFYMIKADNSVETKRMTLIR